MNLKCFSKMFFFLIFLSLIRDLMPFFLSPADGRMAGRLQEEGQRLPTLPAGFRASGGLGHSGFSFVQWKDVEMQSPSLFMTRNERIISGSSRCVCRLVAALCVCVSAHWLNWFHGCNGPGSFKRWYAGSEDIAA